MSGEEADTHLLWWDMNQALNSRAQHCICLRPPAAIESFLPHPGGDEEGDAEAVSDSGGIRFEVLDPSSDAACACFALPSRCLLDLVARWHADGGGGVLVLERPRETMMDG